MAQERKDAKGLRICPQCGTGFVCGIAAGDERCWCFDLPAVMPVQMDTACQCRACLTKAIRQAQQDHEAQA